MRSTLKRLVAGVFVLAPSLVSAASQGAVSPGRGGEIAQARIEVHVGFSKRLEPKGWGVDPVIGVQVRLFHVDDPLVTLGAATSDALGNAVFDVMARLIELDEKGNSGLRCEPLHAGFMRKARVIRAAEQEDSAAPPQFTANVYLAPGATQRIRVLGADDDARHTVQVSRWESTELETRQGEVIGGRVLKRVRHVGASRMGGGIHYVHFSADVKADLVLLKVLGRGTGVVQLPVDSRGFVEPTAGVLDVQIRGVATLSGTILDDTGAPAPGLLFWYRWAELNQTRLDRDDEPLSSTLLVEGLGWFAGGESLLARPQLCGRQLDDADRGLRWEAVSRPRAGRGDRAGSASRRHS